MPGELIIRRAEKIKTRFGEDIRIGRFAGFDLFLRPGFNNTVEMVLRGKNSYSARVTDTALGTIRSLEATVQGFEERAARLESDITDANKRAKELGEKVGAQFEREDRYQELTRRQSEIEEKLDLTKNQAPSQVEAVSADDDEQKNSENQTQTHSPRPCARDGHPPMNPNNPLSESDDASVNFANSSAITQAELSAWLHAIHAPITRDVIANWETGRSDVPAYCIQIIAYSLGVKVSDILPELTFKGLISGRLMLNPASKLK